VSPTEGGPVGAHIRNAVVADADALTVFATAVFRDTYGAVTAVRDMDAYVAECFHRAAQEREIADATAHTLPAMVDGEIAGFAQCRCGPAPECLAERGMPSTLALQIQRFYVGTRWHGRGVAQELMAACVQLAGTYDAPVWLGVYAENARAIRFYAKSGFRPAGTTTFTLGAETHVDALMARPSTMAAP
jgi:GNAT superfamily N-acetyltransferase